MATRAERAKYDTERTKKPAAKAKKTAKKTATKANGESLRAARAAHDRREKRDATLNLREDLQKGSPEAKARKSKAATKRARGSA